MTIIWNGWRMWPGTWAWKSPTTWTPSTSPTKALGLEEACLFAYCPGCRTMHTDPAIRNLPALEVNGELKFWNIPATDEQLRSCLEQYLSNEAERKSGDGS